MNKKIIVKQHENKSFIIFGGGGGAYFTNFFELACIVFKIDLANRANKLRHFQVIATK